MDDEQLRDALRADQRLRWKTQLQQLEREMPMSATRRSLWTWAAVAVLALAIGGSIWLLRAPTAELSTQELMTAYLEAPPNSFRPSVRGEEPTTPLELALKYYDTEQYEQAQTALETLKTQGELPAAVNVYLGASYLQTGKPAKAIDVLTKASSPTTEWLLALAYLMNGEPEAGRSSLTDIVATPDHPFKTRAAALLKRLDN